MNLTLTHDQVVEFVSCANAAFAQRCNRDQLSDGLPDGQLAPHHIERALSNGNIAGAQQVLQLSQMLFPAAAIDQQGQLWLLDKQDDKIVVLFQTADPDLIGCSQFLTK